MYYGCKQLEAAAMAVTSCCQPAGYGRRAHFNDAGASSLRAYTHLWLQQHVVACQMHLVMLSLGGVLVCTAPAKQGYHVSDVQRLVCKHLGWLK